MQMNSYFTYIMASEKNGTLYVGFTSNLHKRIWGHKTSIGSKFTTQYSVKKLVYYETYQEAELGIKREKQLKSWLRKWKIDLIEKNNPNWNDLYEHINT